MDSTEEYDALQNLLFGSSDRPDFASESVSNYVEKLGTFNIDQLRKETLKLLDVKTSIQERKQELAVSHYQTFIQTAECSKASFKQFVNLEEKLSSLLDNIPKFEGKCESFSKESDDINQKRRLNTIMIVKNAQILEILELPQLMETFIRDNLYEEALELASFVHKMQNKQQEIPILKDIVKEVDELWQQMQRQLIAQLSTHIQLPTCLQIVGHLRRMGTFSESELRLKFLQARNVWFEETLKTIPTNDAAFHLSKTIEVTRVNLFSIINQYRAIFNDDEHSPLTSHNRHQFVNQNCIFFGWIREKIGEFLKSLETDLNSPAITTKDSYLGQCMYFGLSFSKVGCDFRHLLAPLFSRAVYRQFSTEIQTATSNFHNNLEKFTLINKNQCVNKWTNRSAVSGDSLQPPDSLLEFYPLANYLNKVLTAMSSLRLCPIISIVEDVLHNVQESLVNVSQGILMLYAQEHQAFTANSRDSFTRLCMSFANDLVPFVQKALHIIYPPNYLAQYLGISVQQLQESGITYLNKERIIESVGHLLPKNVKTLQFTIDNKGVEETENFSKETEKEEFVSS